MINSSKLLSRTSKQGLSSRKVLVDLTIVKRDVVRIDSLLKERLVLTKVREGIMRQKRENDMRVERERQLEEKREDDSANVDPEKKKNPKSILGNIIKFVLGGFLNIIGKITFRILPRLPFLLKTIVRFTRFFGTIIRGTFNIASTLIKAAPKFISKFGKFTGKILTQIIGVITRSIVPAATTFVGRIAGLLSAPFAGAGTRAAVTRATRPAVRPTVDPKIKRVGNKQLSFDDIFQREGFLRNIEQQRILEEVTTDKLQIKKKRLAKERQMALFDELPKGGGLIDPESFKQRKTVTKKFTAQDFVQEDFIQTKSRFGSLAAEAEESKKLLERLGVGKARKIPKVLADKNFLLDKEAIEKLIKTNVPDADAESLIFKAFTDKKAAKDVGEDAILDAIAKAKLPKVVGKKGLAKFLGNIGGAQFLKPIRKFLNNTVKQIPFLGDLIGLLLDIFVFGEPVGRAAFMAIGGILGGFLGGAVGSLVPGPGTIIGGIIGGIGGDLVGGLIYDLIFGRKPAVNEAGTVTKGVVKGVSKSVQKFEEGGVVRNYEPPKQVSTDRSSDLRSLAFYEKNQVGREVMVPIPIPIPSSKNQGQGSKIVINKTSGRRSAFSQHYRRG